MPNGKPGDAPWTDFFVHKYNIFPGDMARMLRALYAYSPNLIEHLAYPDMWDWEQGKNINEGREKLQQLMVQHGVTSQDET